MKRQILFFCGLFFSLMKERSFIITRERKTHMRKEDEEDEKDLCLLLPCWHSVARKLRVASARDAQKEVLRRAGWETCVLSCSPKNLLCDDACLSPSKSARVLSLSLFCVRRRVVVVYFLTDALTFRFSVAPNTIIKPPTGTREAF